MSIWSGDSTIGKTRRAYIIMEDLAERKQRLREKYFDVLDRIADIVDVYFKRYKVNRHVYHIRVRLYKNSEYNRLINLMKSLESELIEVASLSRGIKSRRKKKPRSRYSFNYTDIEKVS